MNVEFDGENFRVNSDEFTRIVNDEFNTLVILESVGEFDRIISLLKELTSILVSGNLGFIGASHGGYIPIKCSKFFNKVYVSNSDAGHVENISYNIQQHSALNVEIVGGGGKDLGTLPIDILVTNDHEENFPHVFDELPIILAPSEYKVVENDAKRYILTGTTWSLTIPKKYQESFNREFRYYLSESDGGVSELNYNNLVHLSMIVKNGGKEFENMLLKNLHHFDRWTILDTGSTDGTLEIINRVLVGKKKGELYQEPFINFRESRNRCLDLTGTSCKFVLTLDDTYVVDGDLRKFLSYVRGDQAASSFSLFVKSGDVEYTSNRIIKSALGLRYIYTIHEVIQMDGNLNVGIPKNLAMIIDDKTDYMHDRTMIRKEFDLKLLFDMVKEEPDNPRHLYYIAQTYNIMDRRKEANEYFLKRVNHPVEGYIQERVDSYFEAARNCHLHLGSPWEECEKLYLKAYDLDNKRPDSLYFMGIHYMNEGKNEALAFEYMKRAFRVGYPLDSQHSLKPTLSFHFLPIFLARLCYNFEDYALGQEACQLFLQNNEKTADSYDLMVSWNNIYVYLNRMPPLASNPYNPKKPYVCFVADGGFAPWTGSDILSKGVGGSETFIIEIARYIQRSGQYNAIVFCNCPSPSVFEGVEYRHLNEFFPFVSNVRVFACMISRFTEYLPVALKGYVENVYLILHDLSGSGNIIPRTPKLKKVFCLTNWHVGYFTNMFPSLKDITVPFNYGIDFKLFLPPDEFLPEGPRGRSREKKVRNRFIYSSFPNRGLLPLLQMWPRITEKCPDATLHIHSDVDGKWVNGVYSDGIKEIKKLLGEYTSNIQLKNTIYYHGWTSKKELAESWLVSDIWFYPCIFKETFCLTALEAALTKTFAITSDLAALQDTVGERGVRIGGDPMSKEWQDLAVSLLTRFMSENDTGPKNSLIEKNYEWAKKMSWENRATCFKEEYLDKNYEYVGMINWTGDVPPGHKKYFLEAIDYFNSKKLTNPPRVLEIGTYAGTSLIEILNCIPRSTAVAVDLWRNYNEKDVDILKNIEENSVQEIFHRNIKRAGLTDRVVGVQGDSLHILMTFLKGDEKFDFIYIDGSHKCLDCYSDLILSWELLNSGGVLAVDDYLFSAPTELERPKEAVDSFLKKYEGKYRIISKTYRVFLEKL